jgi:hypothetical protein
MFSYFTEDDFHWLAGARRFAWGDLFDLTRYDHFYRPMIELYFVLGQQLFRCAAFPFHVASIGIHLLNTTVLFVFARRLSDSRRFASLTVVLFVVQPGYAEAVAWVAAITDLLPAFWYLLTLLLHLSFLQTGRWWAYVAALATFVACLLTHESSATLLPMMLALDALLVFEGRHDRVGARPADWVARYAPFATLLALSLIVAYVVNSRSYLIREGYYAFGPHAFRHAAHYMVALYVGKRALVDYVLIVAALALVVGRGTLRMRFCVVLILVTMLPVLFFTWGIASRYLYVPAAGFALLLADVLMASQALLARRLSPRAARAVTTVVALVLALRFAAFTQQGSADFRDRTTPYERFAAAIAGPDASLPPDRVLYIDSQVATAIPELYRDPAAETIFCEADVHIVVR